MADFDDNESFIGAQADVLESYMAKRGGRKNVDPYVLRAHGSKSLDDGSGHDEEDNVGSSMTLTLSRWINFCCMSYSLLSRTKGTKIRLLPVLATPEVSLQSMTKCENVIYHSIIINKS